MTLLVSSCGGSERGAREAEFSDSAGVVVVSNAGATWAESGAWTLSAPPTVRMGAANDDPQHEFYRVADVRSLPDGRIVVADGGSLELRVYDSAGRMLVHAGGEGQGPGEFQQLGWVRVLGDSLVVYDPALARVSVFTVDGRFVRLVSLMHGEHVSQPTALGLFDDGTLLIREATPWEAEPGFLTETSQYLRVGAQGEYLDSLGEFPYRLHLVTRAEDGATVDHRVPFASHSITAVAGGAFYFSDGVHFQLLRYGEDGTLERVSRRDTALVPVTEDDRKHYIAGFTAASGNPLLRQRFEQAFGSIPLPRTKPTYMDIRADPEGYVWLEDYHPLYETTPSWSVYDARGRYLGKVELPDRFVLFQIGDGFLLGVRPDDRGVEYVEEYALSQVPAG